MHTFKAYYLQPNDRSTDESLPDVQADSEQTAAFIAATRWITAALNRGEDITGMVIVLDGAKARVVLGEGEVLDFYATLA